MALPQWDSWWCPTYHNITRIQYLMGCDDDGMGRSCFLDFEWLLIGAPATFHELTGKTLWSSTATPNTNSTMQTATLIGMQCVE